MNDAPANAHALGHPPAEGSTGLAATAHAGTTVQYGVGMLGAPRWLASLHLVAVNLGFARRTVGAGEMIQVAGNVFTHLQIVNVGTVKTVHLTASGREQIVGLHFRGDWVGLDALASGRFACDAYAMEPSEIWSVCYASVLSACGHLPELTRTLHIAMGDELRRHHEWRWACCRPKGVLRISCAFGCRL
ncbi:Crp/Fnr family transcriptional regulator [Rhodoferax aquaticus]|uniref:Crp/Fnr family transcriptional regulator n=1 Tax=Rhodoferax aquaticus TaxID=2527691 RepID=A0A515EUC4_9BURK|nr:Crp/Fnr family transcriptional regulator [Rhodoferax aquaticus]QDL56280.1 Crp/Fnr family transcriptional regulator [Rhodoferax aquaticus]